jgi:outer membrane protein assembly factor BamE (lipoprotein component of BamABCDE complex)
MRRSLIVLAALFVAGCALVEGRGLVAGKSTRAQVIGEMGRPAMTLSRPNGDTWLYFTREPLGRATYVATVGADGLFRGMDQRLVYANIYAVRAGMREQEVRELLGPPMSVTRLPRQERNVWEYRWRHAVRELRVLWVQFGDDGVVREAVELHDHEFDPENDRG